MRASIGPAALAAQSGTPLASNCGACASGQQRAAKLGLGLPTPILRRFVAAPVEATEAKSPRRAACASSREGEASSACATMRSEGNASEIRGRAAAGTRCALLPINGYRYLYIWVELLFF